MSRYKIPLVWQMYGYAVVKAESRKAAVQYALGSDCPLPRGEYLDGTVAVDESGIIDEIERDATPTFDYKTHPFPSDDSFLELESKAVTALRKGDEGYAALVRRKKELEERFPFIESVLEGAGAVSLSEGEHAGLSEYTAVSFKMESIERRSLYLAGHRDCLAYLKCVGAL